MIFHENRLLADDSHAISYLIVFETLERCHLSSAAVAHFFWPVKCCISYSMCLYQVMMMLHFLNGAIFDVESTGKTIITPNRLGLKSEPTCKLINRIPGLRHIKFTRLRIENTFWSTRVLKALPYKLDIKRHSPSILNLSCMHWHCSHYAVTHMPNKKR